MRKQILIGLAVVVGGLMLTPTTAQADLLGDSVEASMTEWMPAQSINTQFASPAIVGAGTEFSGILIDDPTGWLAGIDLDVSSTGFTITGIQLSPIGGVGGPNPLFRIDLTDLDWAGPPGMITGLNDLGGSGFTVSSTGFTANSAFVEFTAVSFGPTASHSFSFNVVPEPGTALLLGSGLLGLASLGRRQS